MTAPQPIREYEVRARSTDVFGRVLCSAREHHFIIDGPVQNECPGEEVTPPEAFLAGVAACGVELLHVIAKADGVPLGRVTATLNATVDRAPTSRYSTAFGCGWHCPARTPRAPPRWWKDSSAGDPCSERSRSRSPT